MMLVDRVADLVKEVVSQEVLPRFQTLRDWEIESKDLNDSSDLVTTVDRLVERRFAAALPALLPGSAVIGEEAVHSQPHLLDGLDGSGPVWLVDPIDGTSHFARGENTYGVMVALVVSGVVRAGWIAIPSRDQIFAAQHGGGAYLNGTRLRTAPPPTRQRPRGSVYSRLMPPGVAADVEERTSGRYEACSMTGSAAIEYTAIIQGHKDFGVFHRLLPWDHAAGVVILTEAGGCVSHQDGRPYDVRARDQLTVAAVDADLCSRVRDWLK